MNGRTIKNNILMRRDSILKKETNRPNNLLIIYALLMFYLNLKLMQTHEREDLIVDKSPNFCSQVHVIIKAYLVYQSGLHDTNIAGNFI